MTPTMNDIYSLVLKIKEIMYHRDFSISLIFAHLKFSRTLATRKLKSKQINEKYIFAYFFSPASKWLYNIK